MRGKNIFSLGTTASSENDTLEFELKIKCSYNKDANKNSSRVEDIYKNINGIHIILYLLNLKCA